MNIVVYCVNSFTYNSEGGNSAGVVLNADNLNEQQMQYIATQIGYSETAFVQADQYCDFNVRFFTPNNEVDFCGHATLAVFHLLFKQHIIEAREYTQQTKVGKLTVKVALNGLVSMNQALPQYLGEIDKNEVADLLNIPRGIFATTNLPCEIISTGLADVIIPIPSDMLDSLIPDHIKISEFSEKYNVVGLHLFELQSLQKNTSNNITANTMSTKNVTASCRNFAPLFGIHEESATGSACGALSCYLDKHDVVKTNDFIFEQGRKMKSPSMLAASIFKEGDVIKQVKVSGFAHEFKKIKINSVI